MRLLHTMLRVGDMQRSIDFYTKSMGMQLLRTTDRPDQKYSLAFVGYADESQQAVIELTYNYGVDELRPWQRLRTHRHRRRRYPGHLRSRPSGRRPGDARAGAGQRRHHGHCVRSGSRRIQDRADSALIAQPATALDHRGGMGSRSGSTKDARASAENRTLAE